LTLTHLGRQFMNEFKIVGKYTARQFVEFCVAQEIQFEIYFKKNDTEKVLVAFYKGIWSICMLPRNEILAISDTGEVDTENDFYRGFLLSKISIPWIDIRKEPAKLICDFLDFRFNFLSKTVRKINVLQIGRNGTISNGKISLIPRKEEFRIKEEEVWI